ncbi:MAG TPA: hypothetical protein VGK32_19675 [Vicinamibacterales bacterium]
MNGSRYHLIALHGFLGRASDWDPLVPCFPAARLTAIDLWPVVSEASGWSSVGPVLAARLAQARSQVALPAYLVAYSFGARLALAIDALGAGRTLVDGACLISCQPGFHAEDEAARSTRRTADKRWAQRIRDLPAEDLWRAWDAQPVFAGSAAPQRSGDLPAPRGVLAAALGAFSLADQPDFRGRLLAWQRPLLWLSGANDPKFDAVARGLESDGVPARFVSCQDAGHRVPWDNPARFAAVVTEWIDGVTGA